MPSFPGETGTSLVSDESVDERMRRIGVADTNYEIIHRTAYYVHQRVADTYRKGRIFLAGDSAHINNPLGGMGMNGGIHDGLNIADVLAIIFGLTFDHRVRGDRLQRAFHIGSDQLNLAQCIDHGSIPIAGPWRAGFRGTLTRKPYARLTTGDDFKKPFARQLQASLGR